MTAPSNTSEKEVLTVNEYADRFNIPIDTVRSRIRLGKLQTTQIDRAGRSRTGIVVEQSQAVNKTVSTLLNNSLDDRHAQNGDSEGKQLLTVYKGQIEDLKAEAERLRLLVEKWEGEANSWRTMANESQSKVAELSARLEKLDVVEKVVDAQKQTIDAQRIANEALNNERIVITQQLQKYRSQEDQKPQGQEGKLPGWMFWKK